MLKYVKDQTKRLMWVQPILGNLWLYPILHLCCHSYSCAPAQVPRMQQHQLLMNVMVAVTNMSNANISI